VPYHGCVEAGRRTDEGDVVTLALHNSGLPFVLAMVLGLIVLYAALVLLGDDEEEDRWLR
jgi:hypothetical protein